ncbi:MAG: hypothetical protein ACYTFG_12700 [Planctomycetota bacterium]|jgi:hypothetical protein
MMTTPPFKRRIAGITRPLLLSVGLFGLPAAGIVLFVGCPKKPTPPPVTIRKGTSQYDRSKVPTKKSVEEPLPRVVPVEYAVPESPREHRMDMLENEWSAYSTLRAITVGQKHFSRHLRPTAKDLDGDGIGEFAYLLEMSGISHLQRPGGKTGASLMDSADWRWFRAKDEKDRPILWPGPAPKGKPTYHWETQDGYEFLVHRANKGVVWRIYSNGVARREGYCFVLYLPGKEKAEVASGDVPPGDPTLADARERRFCAYAWPWKPGVTGRRIFFTDRFEAVWGAWNLKANYGGLDRVPPPEAAFEKGGPNPRNLHADPGIAFDDSPTLERTGLTSCDGETWKIFGERKDVKRKFEKKWTVDEEVEDFKKDGGTEQTWWKGK